jgi:hypothetical protein
MNEPISVIPRYGESGERLSGDVDHDVGKSAAYQESVSSIMSVLADNKALVLCVVVIIILSIVIMYILFVRAPGTIDIPFVSKAPAKSPGQTPPPPQDAGKPQQDTPARQQNAAAAQQTKKILEDVASRARTARPASAAAPNATTKTTPSVTPAKTDAEIRRLMSPPDDDDDGAPAHDARDLPMPHLAEPEL